MKSLRCALLICVALCVARSASANDQPIKEALGDAWWNGPLLSIPAGTIPEGSFAAGAGLLDQISHAGSGANAVPAPDLNQADFRAAVVYGVSDDFNLSLWPLVGLGTIPKGQSSSDVQLGDWFVDGQYRVRDFQPGDSFPAISLNFAETFPIGQYDRLSPFSAPLGAGAYSTTLGLYTQMPFWMATGHILRAELNLSYTLSSRVGVQGLSVYGTQDGFLGHANPGTSALGDLTLEYSLSRRWSAASEIQLELDNPTHVAGTEACGMPLRASSGLGHVLYVTPYLEYGWSPSEGVSFGARIYALGHNETPTVTPVILFQRYFG